METAFFRNPHNATNVSRTRWPSWSPDISPGAGTVEGDTREAYPAFHRLH